MVLVYEDGTMGSMSYPKFLMQKELGRNLEKWETVDHINDNRSDDRVENFQILSRKDNILKSVKKGDMFYFICPECKKESERPLRHVRHARKQGKTGPFCSRECAGTYNARIQYSV